MFDELFLKPFLTGLGLAIVLPWLGSYLRLRGEWLAALAYAHVAAAGALLAAVGGLPAALGGALAAALAGVGKRAFARRLAGGASYALLLLGGWSIAVLTAANQPLAERLGHALFDGQLYFSDTAQLGLVLAVSPPILFLLHRLSRSLLLAQIYPDFFRLRHPAPGAIHVRFDLLAALVLALATMSLGVMGAFALTFVPPWLAFRRANSWRTGLVRSVAIGGLVYVIAFLLALRLDQPFGPMLAILLVLFGLIVASMERAC